MKTKSQKIGLLTTTSLVVGNMIGVGIFVLPAVLSSYGSISLLGWIFTATGALILAKIFSNFSRIIVSKSGGPYVYSKAGFGDFIGFLVAWGYWIACWVGNGAIAIAIIGAASFFIPELAKDILEQLVFEARKSEYVDVKSGVSARLSITAFENLVSTAERRLLHSGDDKTAIRMSDFTGIIPAITGKIELVYEGEQEGAYNVALTLLGNAIKSLYSEFFPKIEKIEKQGVETPYDEIVSWFFNNSEDFEILDDISEKDLSLIHI